MTKNDEKWHFSKTPKNRGFSAFRDTWHGNPGNLQIWAARDPGNPRVCGKIRAGAGNLAGARENPRGNLGNPGNPGTRGKKSGKKVHFFAPGKTGFSENPDLRVKSRARNEKRGKIGKKPGLRQKTVWDQDAPNVPPDFSQSKAHNRT